MITPADTRIMATLTPGQCTPQFLTDLVARGLAGIRINSAHVRGRELVDMVEAIRSAAPGVEILMDTKGAEVRTTEVASPVEITEGMEVEVRYAPDTLTTAGTICLNAPDVQRYIVPGQPVNIDDNALRFEVVEVNDDSFRMKALNSATLGSRKTVNFPDIDLPHLPSVTELDREAIIAAVATGVDMIAHSFVRTARDVEAVRELTAGTPIKIYSKIECRMALDNLDTIMEASDGILFARGDLGSAIPLETIPVVQQKVMTLCARHHLPTILSTQILQSMMASPTPTRAEVSDIYLGVTQGADWLLLTGETAQGQYPAECIDIMRRTINVTRSFLLSE